MDLVRFGRSVLALRRRRRWRQEDLAQAAGVSRTAISRIELGRGDRLTVRALDRIAAALGARVDCRIGWNGEAIDRLLDGGHARLVERILRWLERFGWEAAVEVSFNVYGERGSVDVLGFHRGTRCLLVIEAKTVVPDMQAMLVAPDRKARLGTRVAHDRGWDATSVSRLLVVAEDRTARRRVESAEATFRRALPHRTMVVRAYRRAPDPGDRLAGLVFLSGVPHTVARQRIARADPAISVQ